MTETDDPIVSTFYTVVGVRDDDDVRQALQALYDVFADVGLGQGTFELTGTDAARLVVKHKDSVTPDTAAMARALASAGDFRLVE